MPFQWVSREQATERRRASEEYGGKRPTRRNTEQHRTPWRRHMDRSRKVWRGTRKHYRRHKHKRGALAVVIGAVGLAMLGGMWAFSTTTQVATGVVCAGAVVGGYALHKHDEAKVMRGTRRPTEADRERIRHAWTQPHTRRPAAAPEQPATGKVHVTGHRREDGSVTSYTRRRPNEGAEAPGGGWSAGDTKANPESKQPPTATGPSKPATTSGSDPMGPQRGGGVRSHRGSRDLNAKSFWFDSSKPKCKACKGRGHTDGTHCSTCRGWGNA